MVRGLAVYAAAIHSAAVSARSVSGICVSRRITRGSDRGVLEGGEWGGHGR